MPFSPPLSLSLPAGLDVQGLVALPFVLLVPRKHAAGPFLPLTSQSATTLLLLPPPAPGLLRMGSGLGGGERILWLAAVFGFPDMFPNAPG